MKRKGGSAVLSAWTNIARRAWFADRQGAKSGQSISERERLYEVQSHTTFMRELVIVL